MPAHCSTAVLSSLVPSRSERKGEWIAECERLLEDVLELPLRGIAACVDPGAPGCDVGPTRDPSIVWKGMPSSFLVPPTAFLRACLTRS